MSLTIVAWLNIPMRKITVQAGRQRSGAFSIVPRKEESAGAEAFSRRRSTRPSAKIMTEHGKTSGIGEWVRRVIQPYVCGPTAAPMVEPKNTALMAMEAWVGSLILSGAVKRERSARTVPLKRNRPVRSARCSAPVGLTARSHISEPITARPRGIAQGHQAAAPAGERGAQRCGEGGASGSPWCQARESCELFL